MIKNRWANMPLTLIIALASVQGAHAQEAAAAPTIQEDSEGSQDIVVTAQKRSETLTSVPMSITAVGGDRLQKVGITSVADLTKIVPGFAFQPSEYGSPILTLRGVGLRDKAIAASPTVAVYVDQVPLPFSEMTRGTTLDLERVEVLKGPQGTLFGQNSTGGAINYIAAKPTDIFEGNASLTYGRFNELNGELVLSGPITDGLNGRIAVRTEQRDDWQRSKTRDDTLGSRNFTTGRLLLDWAPTSSLTVSANINGWVDKSDTPASQFVGVALALPAGRQTLVPYLNAQSPAPDNNRLADWDPGFSFRRDDYMIQGSLRVDWTVAPETTLTSISAYSKYRQESPIDTDGLAVKDFRLTIFGRIDSFSQELRLAGTALESKLKWTIGANYESDKTKDSQLGDFEATNAVVGAVNYDTFINENKSDIDAYAVFAGVDYDLTDELTLQGSIRYTHSKRKFAGCLRDYGGQLAAAINQLASAPITAGACVTLDPATFQGVPIVTSTLSENNVPWRIGLSFKPSSDSNYYFNVTKGYKAGIYPTVPGLIPSQFEPIKQESILAYEIGFKKAFFGNKLRASGAAFYYDYTDKQILGYINTFLGNLPGLISIPKGEIKGAELQLDIRPLNGLSLTVGGTYIDSKVVSDFIGNDPLQNAVNFKGEAFPGAPKWQYSVDGQYEFPVSGSVNAFVGGTLSYRSAAQVAFGNHPLFLVPGYSILDLRAGIETGPWRLQLFGRNVTNKFYLTSVARNTDSIARVVGMPVTYGVTVSRKF